jgi:hypothetical protein
MEDGPTASEQRREGRECVSSSHGSPPGEVQTHSEHEKEDTGEETDAERLREQSGAEGARNDKCCEQPGDAADDTRFTTILDCQQFRSGGHIRSFRDIGGKSCAVSVESRYVYAPDTAPLEYE